VTVSIEAPPIASRPINLAPGAAADIVTAAVGGALDLHALRTGALRRRLKTKIPSSTLVSASVPAPVCLGLATTGAAVFAATVAAMADAGIAADGAALWRSHVAVQGDGAFDRATGKITPARAAAIRAREAEEASA
jgi:N-methylhydantoinase B/oxoprolinase/acetone carboxylase alpha subunit